MEDDKDDCISIPIIASESKNDTMDPQNEAENEKTVGRNGGKLHGNSKPSNANCTMPDKKSNPFRSAFQAIEDLIIFSLIYIHNSPLQPLIGPGITVVENHSLVHVCYLVILSFVPIAFGMTNLPGIRGYLNRDVNLCTFVIDKQTCEDIVSSLFTNRFSLAVSSLFVFMALITMKCFARNEHSRPSLDNGFWILKLMLMFIVSLIAFSIPPGAFDALWYCCSIFGSLVQSFFMIFLLLDFTNDALIYAKRDESEHGKLYTKRQLVSSILTISLFVMTSSVLIYTIMCSFRAKTTSFLDIALLLLPAKLAVSGIFFVQRNVSSILQFIVILSFLMLRVGLSLAYEPSQSGNQAIYKTYLSLDSLIKIFIISYAFSRKSKSTHYSFYDSTVYGCATQGNLDTSDKTIGNYEQIKSEERISRFPEKTEQWQKECKKQKGASAFEGGPKGKTKCHAEYERDNMWNSYFYLGQKIYNEEMHDIENQTKDFKNNLYELQKQKSEWGSTRIASYSHSLLHVHLLVTCLDLNSNLTGYKIVIENGSNVELDYSLISIITLKITCLVTMFLYVWTRVVKKFHNKIDEFSVSSLLVALLQAIVRVFTKIMIEAPMFAATAHRTRFVYSALLAASLGISSVALFPPMKQRLEKSTLFCSYKTQKGMCLSADPSLVALHRISLSVSVFFLLLSLILIRVRSVNDKRNQIHIGFWPSKLLLLAVILIATFYIPTKIGNFWTHMALGATLMITLLQTIVLLDLTTKILDYVRVKEEVSKSSKRIFFSCSSIAVLLYTMTITAFFCFYVYFAQFSVCKSNRIFIFINLGLCIIACVISLHPAVRDGGLVQSAMVTSFCMYCTWTALYNNPKDECNPMAHDIFENDARPTKAVLFAIDMVTLTATVVYATIFTARIQAFLRRFAFTCFRCKCLKTQKESETSQGTITLRRPSFRDALLGYRHEKPLLPQNVDDVSKPLVQNEDDISSEAKETIIVNENPVPYNYSLFHAIYALLSMHFFLLLVTWIDERPGSHIKVSFHWAIMCIKMVASSASVLLYMWSLVVHLFLNAFSKRSAENSF